MPVVIPPSSTPTSTTTTTVQNIIDKCLRDLNDRFAMAPMEDMLIDYTNRIQQMILRERSWSWMVSDPQRFLTVRGQKSYWVAEAGANADGVVDTGLGLSDVRSIQAARMFVNNQWRPLWPAGSMITSGSRNPDGTFREGEPLQWTTAAPQLAGEISIYPTPNEGSTWEMVPAAPSLTTATDGALSARTYYVRLTFVDEAGGESVASNIATRWIPANDVMLVRTPTVPLDQSYIGIGYTQYRIYASTTRGAETLQDTVAIGSDWQEPGSGLTTNGATVPASSTLEPIKGHLIEFEYYKKHTRLISTADTLLIPDDYADVVVAGVNMLAAQFLHRSKLLQEALPEVVVWQQLFKEGLSSMRSDEPSSLQFIHPDPMAFPRSNF